MRGKNSGKMVRVIEGVHKDKEGIAYNRDQVNEVRAAGKILVELQTGKVLIDPKNLKLIGFVD